MDALKKFFPISFNRNDTGKNLAIGIIIYVVAAIVAGLIIFVASKLTTWIPGIGGILGWAFGVIGTLIEVYVVAGIIIRVLDYLKVIK